MNARTFRAAGGRLLGIALIPVLLLVGGCADSAAPTAAPVMAPAGKREDSARFALAGRALETPSPASPAPKPADDAEAEAAKNAEAYAQIVENPFRKPTENPLSTFSIDVDTASYSNVRRFLTQNTLPPKDAVRLEELINYFPYDYPRVPNQAPFLINVEATRCPWDEGRLLAKIGIKAREIDFSKRPASNLVFLLDVSGSMNDENKLPLVKKSLRLLLENLGENDRVSIVVYAGASGLVLPPTSCDRKTEILAALDRLQAGGPTNGAGGIQLAYDTAVAHFIKGGTNRVILCTDGDFNVGVTNQGDLARLIEAKAKSGVFLSVLGFGAGNLKDNTIERLADKGNGNAAYIDTIKEARKVLVEQIGGTLITVAKDVKIQVEFNPALVESYRLIGYENRLMKAKDFDDDAKDAGEIGAGHVVTALYEIVPAGEARGATGANLVFQKPAPAVVPAASTAKDPTATGLFLVKLRHKAPDADESKLIEFTVGLDDLDPTPSDDLRFAAAVAQFGMLLRDSPHKGDATWDDVLTQAESSLGKDAAGHRREFLELVRKAKELQGH